MAPGELHQSGTTGTRIVLSDLHQICTMMIAPKWHHRHQESCTRPDFDRIRWRWTKPLRFPTGQIWFPTKQIRANKALSTPPSDGDGTKRWRQYDRRQQHTSDRPAGNALCTNISRSMYKYIRGLHTNIFIQIFVAWCTNTSSVQDDWVMIICFMMVMMINRYIFKPLLFGMECNWLLIKWPWVVGIDIYFVHCYTIARPHRVGTNNNWSMDLTKIVLYGDLISQGLKIL